MLCPAATWPAARLQPLTALSPSPAHTAADNEEGANNPVCRRFELSSCGQAGGLCSGAPGGWLPPPAPQCPADQRSCPEG